MKDKIKTFFDSKTFFVILSIVLAVCAWLLVLSYTNPITSRTMEIQIDFLNSDAPANLDLQDQTVTYPKIATVTVSGRQDVLNNLAASELEVTVDLSEITKAGATKLKVSKPTCERLGITVNDYYPKTIEFTYDTVVRKNLEIRINEDVSLLKEGYAYASVTSTLSSIPVSGLASLLESCSHVEVNLSDSIQAGSLDSNKTEAFLGRFISTTGEDITHRFNAEQQIMVNIQIAKKVALTYDVTGKPATDFYVSKESISHSHVLVVGDYDALKNLSSISVGTLSVAGKQSNAELSVDVATKLPKNGNLSLVNKVTAKITAEIKAYQTKTFPVNDTNINWVGKSEQFTYTLSLESLEVTIKGKEEQLSKLTLAAMAPTLDVQDKQVVGSYNIPLTFPGLDDSYIQETEYVLTVVITQANAEDDVPSPLPASLEENG
ncbi:MAG: hypothetical protein IKU26_03265 [Clostridia bacterium]|nr:hypothetical protein [Clostridia bacterium]